MRHFAGDVHYDATGFLEKNKDALAESLVSLLMSSSLTLLTADYTFTPAPVPAANPANPASTDAAPSGKSSKKSSKSTLSTKFKADLDNLMVTLKQTVPHFVRCIKPNLEQVGNKFDPVLALNQLKYSGLFEAIRIRKSGYEVRMPIEGFVNRYKHCFLSAPHEVKSSAKQYAEFLVQALFSTMETDATMRERKKVLEKSSQAKGSKASAAPAEGTANSKRQFFVGVTKVFVRSQLLKILFDEFRDASSGNVVTQMQRVVRGFLCRHRLRQLMGAHALHKEEERRLRHAETHIMQQEDELSRQYEMLFRSDLTLQKRLHDAKVKRMQEERLRVAKQRYAAAVLVQKIFRGFFYRKQSRMFMCEKMLEMALGSRNESQMQRALQKPSLWGVSSKLIVLLKNSVKNLILEVMNERFVENQVQEALDINSLDMLRQAIRLAEEHKMPYLPILTHARAAIDLILANKAVVAILADELAKCTCIATLVRRYDVLQMLLQESYVRGLYHEAKVKEGADRLHKVAALVDLRDRMRHAVEICSPTKMDK
ncbi:hypothetical protein EON64_07580 [archaeon]|nr:MAG: hypothetical protein EON64_07580 [archaeon]